MIDFFEHLSKIGGLGQFLVVENVDLPEGIERLAHVEELTNDPATGRAGLFPSGAGLPAAGPPAIGV